MVKAVNMFYLPKLYSKPRAQAIVVAVVAYVVALLLFAAIAGQDRQCYSTAQAGSVSCSYIQQVGQYMPTIFYGSMILWIPLLAIVIAYVIKKIRHDKKPVLSDTLFYTFLTIYFALTIIGLGILIFSNSGANNNPR